MQRELPKQVRTGSRSLTPEQVEEAKALMNKGMTLRQVGQAFGVSRMAIWRLMHREEKEGKSE